MNNIQPEPRPDYQLLLHSWPTTMIGRIAYAPVGDRAVSLMRFGNRYELAVVELDADRETPVRVVTSATYRTAAVAMEMHEQMAARLRLLGEPVTFADHSDGAPEGWVPPQAEQPGEPESVWRCPILGCVYAPNANLENLIGLHKAEHEAKRKAGIEPYAGDDHDDFSIRFYEIPDTAHARMVLTRAGTQVGERRVEYYRTWTYLAHWTEDLAELTSQLDEMAGIELAPTCAVLLTTDGAPPCGNPLPCPEHPKVTEPNPIRVGDRVTLVDDHRYVFGVVVECPDPGHDPTMLRVQRVNGKHAHIRSTALRPVESADAAQTLEPSTCQAPSGITLGSIPCGNPLPCEAHPVAKPLALALADGDPIDVRDIFAAAKRAKLAAEGDE